MSTRNFHSVNKTAIYTITTGDDDEYQDELSSIEYDVIAELNNAGTNVVADHASGTPRDELRSYPAHIYGTVRPIARYEDRNHVIIELVARSGYYSDINLDYIVTYYSAATGEQHEDITDVENGNGMQIGTAEQSRLQSQERRMSRVLDKILAQYTTSLRTVGTFSNGEAVYERN